MFYADLHIHSKFSRATSRDADLPHMAIWARKKGVSVIGTGDFTHPQWFAEIKEKLVPAEPGLFRLRDDVQREVDDQVTGACQGTTRFMLEVAISTIYKRRLDAVSGRTGDRRRSRLVGPPRRSRVAADASCRQRTRVSRGLLGRLRGRRATATLGQFDGQRNRRGAPPILRRHDSRPRSAHSLPRAKTALARPDTRDETVPVFAGNQGRIARPRSASGPSQIKTARRKSATTILILVAGPSRFGSARHGSAVTSSREIR